MSDKFKYEDNFIHIGDKLKLPVIERWTDSAFESEYRCAKVRFENTWGLSFLWASLSYSDNYNHPDDGSQFNEEPERVEIAVLLPESDPKFIWGDPFAYVNIDDAIFLVDQVKTFDSHVYNPNPGDVWIDVQDGSRVLKVVK